MYLTFLIIHGSNDIHHACSHLSSPSTVSNCSLQTHHHVWQLDDDNIVCNQKEARRHIHSADVFIYHVYWLRPTCSVMHLSHSKEKWFGASRWNSWNTVKLIKTALFSPDLIKWAYRLLKSNAILIWHLKQRSD